MLVRYPMIFPLHSHNQQNLVQRRLDGVGVLKHPDFPFVPQLLQLSRWPTFLAHEPKLEWGAQLLGSFYNVYGLFLIEHDRTQSSKQSFLALALAQKPSYLGHIKTAGFMDVDSPLVVPWSYPLREWSRRIDGLSLISPAVRQTIPEEKTYNINHPLVR